MMDMVGIASLPCALFPRRGKGSVAAGGLASTRRLPYPESKRKCGKAAAGKIFAKFELKSPPYALNALEPHISQETMSYHWDKHHRGYVEGLNNLIVGTELEGSELEDIITRTYNKGNILPPFNNAAQIWNHDFFWESMSPNGGGKPSGSLLELIERDFGSFEKFTQQFVTAASTQFGSGWVWLTYKANRLDVGNAVNPCPSEEDKRLVVVKSPNAVNPLIWDYSPLLTIDVWEHAYCLDFQSCRGDYISTFMEKLVSWDVVSNRLEMAKARIAKREREEERWKSEEEHGNTGRDNEAEEMYLDSESDELEAE